MSELLEINPRLDRRTLAASFAATGRLQIRDVLTESSAQKIRSILAEETPWGLAFQANEDGPHILASEEVARTNWAKLAAIVDRSKQATGDHAFAFAYYSYPLVTAYIERWRPGCAQERLLEELNGEEFLPFVREVTGISQIIKVDGQATLYLPGNFLWPHTDSESQRGRRVAYVINLTMGEWRPEWGGYLNFFDLDWDIELAIRPKFNSLILFAVPQWHSVSEVTSVAPRGRYAITGWGRDR